VGDEHKDVAVSLARLGYILQHEHKLEEAEATYQEASPMLRRLFGNDHAYVAETLTGLANVLEEQGKLLEAEPLLREALASRGKLPDFSLPEVAESFRELLIVLCAEGKPAEAESLLNEVLSHERHVSVVSSLIGDVSSLKSRNWPRAAESANFLFSRASEI